MSLATAHRSRRDHAIVAPIDKLSVVFAIVLALVLLGEGLSLKVALGGLLIVAGSLVLVLG